MEENQMLSSIWNDISSSLSRLKEAKELDLEIYIMEELAQKLFEPLATRREAQNAQAPIHQLPNEILVPILKTSMDREDVGQAWQRSKLASVCRRWRELVEGSQELWTTITSRDSLASVSRSLVKSGNSKLDILGEWHYPNFVVRSTDRERQHAFLELVTDHCERWRSLELQLGVRQIGHTDVLNTPNLEYLSLADVNGGIGSGTLPPFPISTGGMARLRYLHLDRVSVRWDGITTPLLSTLILENMPNLGPSLSQLFDILSTCPKLAILHINNVNLGRVSLPNPVSLPHLRDVTLISIPTNVVECVIYFLHGPPYPSETQEGLPLQHPAYSSINNVSFTTVNRVVLDVSRIVIKKDLNSIRFTSDGRCKLELDMVDTWAARGMLLWFHNTTKSYNEKMPPVRLEWNDQGHNSDIYDIRPFATFSCITYLKVGKHNNWSILILQYLSGTSALDFESPSWPFCGLQELYLEFPRRALVGSLAQMITARQQSADHVDPPTPLQRIILGDKDEATLEEPFGSVWPEPLQNVLPIANNTGTQILWYGSEVRQDGSLVSAQ